MAAYAWSVSLPLPHDAAIERVTAALAAEGFGILTRIDIDATLKKKIDADFRPYTILGACNPPLALQALTADPAVGILLPCNVVVEQDGAGSRVWITDPVALFAVSGDPRVAPIAEAVAAKLGRVRAALEAA